MNDILKLNKNISLIRTPFCFSFSGGFHAEPRARLWRPSRGTSAELGGCESSTGQEDRGSCRVGCPSWGCLCMARSCTWGSLWVPWTLFCGSVMKFKSLDHSAFLGPQAQRGWGTVLSLQCAEHGAGTGCKHKGLLSLPFCTGHGALSSSPALQWGLSLSLSCSTDLARPCLQLVWS